MNRTTARVTKALAVTSLFGATAFVTPAAHAAEPAPHSDKVWATAHVDYTVKGLTATLRPSVTGTQHLSLSPEDGEIVSSGVPSVYTLTVPANAVVDRDELGGQSGLGCTEKGSVAFDPAMVSPHPIVVTFPKPGVYDVSLSLSVCTSQETVHKTVKITVPAAAPTKPSEPKPGTTAPATHPTVPTAQPSKPGMGPKVETDQVDAGATNLPLGLAALAGLGTVGGIAVARRRAER